MLQSVTTTDSGRIAVQVGPSKITVEPRALLLAPATVAEFDLRIIRLARTGGRGSDSWRRVSAETAQKLLELGVATKEPPRRGLGGWEKGEFEISIGGDNMRKVHGWRRGGWGVPLYYVAEDGSVIVDDGNRPRPNLTHLLSGQQVGYGWRESVAKSKRLVDLIHEAAPRVERAAPADFTAEEKAAMRAAADEVGS
jgi:hypothetical protein